MAAFECPVVEITGGEPLLQPDVYPLMSELLARGHTVLLETGGHRSVAQVPSGVVRIIDVKCPASGESAKNDWSNLDLLTSTDEVKFVVQDRAGLRVRQRRHHAARARGPVRRGSDLARARRPSGQGPRCLDSRRSPAGTAAAAGAQVHLERGYPRGLTAEHVGTTGITADKIRHGQHGQTRI